MATAVQAAQHLDLSERRFRELLDAGVISRAGAGKYDLTGLRVQYIRHLRKLASGHGAGKADLAQERALLAREQRETAALRNAVSRGEYVRVHDVAEIVSAEYAVVRERIMGLPGKIADACAMQTREVVETLMADEINEMLIELSNPAETTIVGSKFAEQDGGSE
jgi:phage terminase Nu1 subunit (DNA packaging protein)